jgi:hypothetical protein
VSFGFDKDGSTVRRDTNRVPDRPTRRPEVRERASWQREDARLAKSRRVAVLAKAVLTNRRAPFNRSTVRDRAASLERFAK